jgi:hypothetical protein
MFRFLVVALLVTNHLFAGQLQLSDSTRTKKGKLYFLWGYNREIYTHSNLHFQNNGSPDLANEFGNYDFTIYNAKAHDRPNFESIPDIVNLTIPQFNGRIGYYFNDKKNLGIELSYDHAKYIVSDGQTLHIKGTIAGNNIDKDTTLESQNFHFEHSDGANFWMLNLLKRWTLFQTKNGKHNVSLIAKPGAGVVIPRTDVTLFGHRINNNWKVAGAIVGLETGIRTEICRNFVIEFTGKACYANYTNCLVQGKGNGKAFHHFGTLEGILTFGYQFGLANRFRN